MVSHINDKMVRVVGILFFGILIPNATGLIDGFQQPLTILVWQYGYFIFVAFAIWQGNRWLLFRLEERFDWFINPAQKVVAILGMNVFYTISVVITLLSGWYYLAGKPMNWEVIQVNIIVCTICVIFITHAYETVFLIKQRQSDLLKKEQLEKAKAHAELEALKNQIDPHFMFNTLNSLSYLIDHAPKKAIQFTDSLAEVYRYILASKNQSMVMLEDELLFLDRYMAMLRIRFDETLRLDTGDTGSKANVYLIPPLSVFMALENVVKHNEISKTNPMTVMLSLNGEYLRISNPVRPKQNIKASSGIGLHNLNERYKITVQKDPLYTRENGTFQLNLPLLKINNT